MKKLVIINIVLLIIMILIPNVYTFSVTNFVELTQDFKIACEEVKQETIASRSAGPRLEKLHASEQLIEFLKSKEGFDEVATRKKGEKYLTIGHGHYGPDVKKGQRITREQADKLLHDDMPQYEGYIYKWCDYLDLNQNEFDALVSFVYNCGEKNIIKLTGNKTRTKSQMMEHILAYTNSDSESNRRGLLNRRTYEKNLFENGVY